PTTPKTPTTGETAALPVGGQPPLGGPAATINPPHIRRQLSDPRTSLLQVDVAGAAPDRGYPPPAGQYFNPNAFPQAIRTAARHAAAPMSLPRPQAQAPQSPAPLLPAPPLPLLGPRPATMRARSKPQSGTLWLWLAVVLLLMLLSMVLLFTLLH